jgi:hypothetical protein
MSTMSRVFLLVVEIEHTTRYMALKMQQGQPFKDLLTRELCLLGRWAVLNSLMAIDQPQTGLIFTVLLTLV